MFVRLFTQYQENTGRMDIAINLYRDWLELILKEIEKLRQQGFKFDDFGQWRKSVLRGLQQRKEKELKSGVSNTEAIDKQMQPAALKSRFKIHLIHTYLDLHQRMIFPHPRKIMYSSEFAVPKLLKAKVEVLEEEIKKGIALFPRLSRYIFDTRKQDGLLFDWGIHHLHLGTGTDKNHKQLVQSTDELVYAIFDSEYAYFLAISDHDRWADIHLLEIVKKNFPKFIEPYKLKGICSGSNGYSESDIVKLRQAGVSPIIMINDEAYFSPGGGINTAGGSLTSTTKIQQQIHWYEQAENLIKIDLTNLIDRLPKEKYKGINTIELQMNILEDDRITVTDRELNLRIEVMYNDKKNGFRGTRIWNSF